MYECRSRLNLVYCVFSWACFWLNFFSRRFCMGSKILQQCFPWVSDFFCKRQIRGYNFCSRGFFTWVNALSILGYLWATHFLQRFEVFVCELWGLTFLCFSKYFAWFMLAHPFLQCKSKLLFVLFFYFYFTRNFSLC